MFATCRKPQGSSNANSESLCACVAVDAFIMIAASSNNSHMTQILLSTYIWLVSYLIAYMCFLGCRSLLVRTLCLNIVQQQRQFRDSSYEAP